MLNKYLLPKQEIVGSIHFIHDQKVMLDFDLASLYETLTKRINERVKRNNDHFPNDFMLQLTESRCFRLRSISGITKKAFKLNY